MEPAERNWERFKKLYYRNSEAGFSLDISRMNFTDDYLPKMEGAIQSALREMAELEAGSIANADEKRMVGHYWLRDPSLAPNDTIRKQIVSTLAAIKAFASDLHSGKVLSTSGKTFKHLLVVGIGGSALGPQFVNQALRSPSDPMDAYFFDNTDSDGMSRVLQFIPDLKRALCVVISKSGGTKETRNGQLVAKHAFEKAGIPFAKHFVAITGEGSELDKTAVSEGWLERFSMWDWVGGRTSELSAVGLLPAALQGFPIDQILDGAKKMDGITRGTTTTQNPAALLALMWYHAGCGKGMKDMVILPYKDRIELFSRYLQQLVMESIGKELDRSGKKVNQGIAVYGNKGSTDQHAYVQQLRDGLNNFFVTFIEVLEDGSLDKEFEVEKGVTCGDYLSGFFQGTRSALSESDRENITITLQRADASAIGMLIALFERAVGFYASLVNVNAYHQPGVEAGKKAAGEVLKTQAAVLHALKDAGKNLTVDEISETLSTSNRETVFFVLRHLAANGRVSISKGKDVFSDSYGICR